jgi:hypothetical protein
LTEVKTRADEVVTAKWIKKRISDANSQIKNSHPGPAQIKPGDVELQLYGPDAGMTIEDMERAIRGELKGQNTNVRRVAIYRENVLVGEWVRVGSSTVRRFP